MGRGNDESDAVKGESSSDKEASSLELNDDGFKDDIDMLRSSLFISIEKDGIFFKMYRLVQLTILK